QLFSEFADGDALGDGDFARRTGRLRNRFDARGAALGDAGTRANGVQLAFAFFKALFESGTGASRGLAFVNWLAGLRLWRRHDRQRQYGRAGAHRPLSGARGNAARTNGYRSWTSAGVAHGHASAGGTHTGTSCRCSGRSAAAGTVGFATAGAGGFAAAGTVAGALGPAGATTEGAAGLRRAALAAASLAAFSAWAFASAAASSSASCRK